MKEEWKTIEGFSGYEISNLGRVRSIKQKIIKILTQHPNKINKRYMQIKLYDKDGKHKTKLVHQLVLSAFVGPKKENQECNHKDGRKDNNCVSNLEWVDRTENIKHAVENKLYQQGERRYSAKLKLNEINRIRKLAFHGVQLKKIAKYFNVDPSHISRIVSKQKWRHF